MGGLVTEVTDGAAESVEKDLAVQSPRKKISMVQTEK